MELKEELPAQGGLPSGCSSSATRHASERTLAARSGIGRFCSLKAALLCPSTGLACGGNAKMRPAPVSWGEKRIAKKGL
jgi:hypothetical protein